MISNYIRLAFLTILFGFIIYALHLRNITKEQERIIKEATHTITIQNEATLQNVKAVARSEKSKKEIVEKLKYIKLEKYTIAEVNSLFSKEFIACNNQQQ